MNTLCDTCSKNRGTHEHAYENGGASYMLTYVGCERGETVWTVLAVPCGMRCPGYERRQ